jgi:sulfur-oxidizing protein SoxY
MNPSRRHLLRGTLASSTLAVAVAAGLLRPGRVSAATPMPALRDALLALSRSRPRDSGAIQIKAPDIAADGTSVFVEVSTTLPKVDMITIFVERNPQSFIAAFHLAPEVLPALSTRIKIAQTSPVWAVVRSDGQFYKTTRVVTVTVGGCRVDFD